MTKNNAGLISASKGLLLTVLITMLPQNIFPFDTIMLFNDEFQSWSKPVAHGAAAIEPSEQVAKNGSKSLKIILPGKDWGYAEVTTTEWDLTPIRQEGTLEFWAKIEGCGSCITVGLQDSKADFKPYRSTLFLHPYIKETKEWQRVAIPLKDFPDDAMYREEANWTRVSGKIDWAKIESVRFDYSPGADTSDFVMYVDDLKITPYRGKTNGDNVYKTFEEKYGNLQHEPLPAVEKFSWPKKYKAAVSVTHDDASNSQPKNAAPILDKYKIKGTFFLSGSYWASASQIGAWRMLFSKGHELGLHSLNHPCDLAKGFMDPGYSLQEYTMGRMGKELEEQAVLFEKNGLKRKTLTYAYPCGQVWLGQEKKSYVPVVEKIFTAARLYRDELEDAAALSMPAHADPKNVDLMLVPGFACDGKTAAQIIEFIKDVEKNGNWAVLTFHSIEEQAPEYGTKTAEYEKVMKYIASRKKELWAAPFGEVSEYIKNRRMENGK